MALDRRGLLTGGILCTGAIALPGSPIWAQDRGTTETDTCNTLDQMFIAAAEAQESAGAWAITVSPDAVARLRNALDTAKTAFSDANDIEGEARRKQVLEYANAVGTSALLVVGITLGAPVAFAGTVVFGSGMLVARALTSPSTPDGVEIATDVTLKRVTGLVKIAASDGVTITSRNLGTASKVGGHVLGLAGAAYAWIEFARRTDDFRRSTALRVELEKEMATVAADLAILEDIQRAGEIREACAEVLKSDLRLTSGLLCKS